MGDTRDALVEVMNHGVRTIIFVGEDDWVCNINSQIDIFNSLTKWSKYQEYRESH